MSYAPKRPRLTKKQRAIIFGNGDCYLCGKPILTDDWHADHEIARELGGSDGIANLKPAHPECHREKSKMDVKLIAKSNRIRRKFGPVEDRRKTKLIPSRPLQSRPFERKSK